MLLKSNISQIDSNSDEWAEKRLGKFTSSEIHFLMNSSFWTYGCKTYVYRKVGELITGQMPQIKTLSNEIDALLWGRVHESEAIKKFGGMMNLEFIIAQPLITEETNRYGSTPDGLIVIKESADKTAYDVNTLEVKCPFTYHNYISLALCNSPQDLKAIKPEYYYQVLDQMLMCGALKGYFVSYHPDFRKGNMKVIEFRKMQPSAIIDGKEVKFPIAEDMILLKSRKQMAVQKFQEVYDEIASIDSY